MASTRMGGIIQQLWSAESRRWTNQQHPLVPAKAGTQGPNHESCNACWIPACAGISEDRLHRPDFDHVRHEVAQQVLDAVLERRGRGRAAGAGSLHVEKHDPVLVAAEGDVATV